MNNKTKFLFPASPEGNRAPKLEMKPPLSKYFSFYRSDLMPDLFSCGVLGGTLYRYVPRERVWFMKCSVLNN